MKKQSPMFKKPDSQDFSKSEWNLLDPSKLRLQYQYGNSVVAEFVSGHDHVAVLRELVQNEYDAGGSQLKVAFGPEDLRIYGNGQLIDAKGWRRLSVMLGTGQVGGSGPIIEQKVNGIGSKNFGLRSLFLYGDQIYIRSGGFQTVLDYYAGTLQKPEPEPLSTSLPGVEIVVPYRMRKSKDLNPFDIIREKQALDSFATDLASTLMKLAQPQSPKSLRQVEISSMRCDRILALKQSIKVIAQRKGITVVQRTIHLTDSETSSSQGSRNRVEEFEFQRVISLPSQYREKMIPGYYKVPGGRIRIAVSLRKNGRKIDVEHPGHFFYPLTATNAYTGNAISINAPFQMNVDRSEIHNPDIDEFNKWLMDRAIDLTFDLLISNLWERFGVERYLVLQEQIHSGSTYFSNRVIRRLKEDACWITRDKESKNQPQLVEATNIVMSANPALDGYISDSHYLADILGNDPRIQSMVKDCGAKVFGIDSLIRLRCAGKDVTNLATRLTNDDANWCYIDLPSALKGEVLQQKFARSFDTLASRLSKENREDLRKSPTTLAADGSLQAPENLWVADPAIATVCPLPAFELLHPLLIECKTLTRLCNKYDVKKWVQKTAQQIQDGTAAEAQQIAIYGLILGNQGHLDRATWTILRRARILRDHRNEWVAPNTITLRKAPGASKLEAALHFPHPDYENDQKLAEIFGFKKHITGEDLVRYAHIVENRPEIALEFEETLQRFRSSLTRPEFERLKSIAFLQSSQGKLAPPSTLYLHTKNNVICLGDSAQFVAGSHIALYKQLGCMDRPKAEGILAYLAKLRSQGIKPKQPEILYPALVEAIRAKKSLPTTFYKDQPIIWDGRRYSKPVDIFLNRKYRTIFLQSVPCIEQDSSILQQALRSLGVPPDPQPQHWQKLFLWFGQHYGRSGTPLIQVEQNALLRTYSLLGEIPTGVTDDIKCLLDQKGCLHSRAEARAKQYLLDDAPDIAQALMRKGPLPAFANVNGPQQAKLIQFYQSIEISSLTDILEQISVNIGVEKRSPAWCNPHSIIEKIHNHSFLSALKSLADYQLQGYSDLPNSPFAQLQAITSLVFTQSLQIEYRAGNITVQVATDAELDRERFVLVDVQSPNELYELLSQAIANLFVKTPRERRQFANAVYRVLTCASIAETENYLRRQGIHWVPPSLLTETEVIHVDDEFSYLVADTRDEPEIAETTFNDVPQKDVQFVQEVIKDSITNRLSTPRTLSRPTSNSNHTEKDNNATGFSSHTIELPPIESVLPVTLEPLDGWVPQASRTKGSEQKRLWTPSAPVDEKHSKEIGHRGEEIIYRQERERVKRLGYPISRVVWIAKEDPLADYDILSVDEKGQDIWLEIKSTTGRHGHFQWSIAEFEKAMREREQYILWRVYEVDTTHPSIRPFRNPVSMIVDHKMHLDVASLSVEIEPLRS